VKRLRYYVYYLFGHRVTSAHMAAQPRGEEENALGDFWRQCEAYVRSHCPTEADLSGTIT
jgi:hypothetical protein